MVSKGPFPATASEVVAVFDREDEVRFVIDQFRRSGFDRAVLTILSHMELVGKLRELRRDCRDCFPRFQSNGAGDMADMGSAGIARGALIANRDNRDNLFLWVRLADPDHESRARGILARFPARDVHLHGAQPRAATGR